MILLGACSQFSINVTQLRCLGSSHFPMCRAQAPRGLHTVALVPPPP